MIVDRVGHFVHALLVKHGDPCPAVVLFGTVAHPVRGVFALLAATVCEPAVVDLRHDLVLVRNVHEPNRIDWAPIKRICKRSTRLGGVHFFTVSDSGPS